MSMIFKPSYDGPKCDLDCYCDTCVDNATQWYQWCYPGGEFVGGTRFWRLGPALSLQAAAATQGATELWFIDTDEDISVKLTL